ncbi:MAG: hypothetical protein HUK15_10110, partial [Bacteroidales bacterium]|nr:hypothetical protein [Bacteroidales bacterium]
METKGNLSTQGDSQEFKGYNEAKRIAEERKHIHPEGKIKLLNGNLLDGYPKKKVEVHESENGAVKNTISLDTTGTYMVIKGQRKKKEAEEAERRKRDEEKEAFERLFTDNAFYLLMHSERILSDSRMFLAPAPTAGGLAYIGTSGFRDAVLGVFIEFWKYCPSATKFNKDGDLQVVTYMAGSPLSGSNQCVMVDEHGKGEGVLIKPFYD